MALASPRQLNLIELLRYKLVYKVNVTKYVAVNIFLGNAGISYMMISMIKKAQHPSTSKFEMPNCS